MAVQKYVVVIWWNTKLHKKGNDNIYKSLREKCSGKDVWKNAFSRGSREIPIRSVVFKYREQSYAPCTFSTKDSVHGFRSLFSNPYGILPIGMEYRMAWPTLPYITWRSNPGKSSVKTLSTGMQMAKIISKKAVMVGNWNLDWVVGELGNVDYRCWLLGMESDERVPFYSIPRASMGLVYLPKFGWFFMVNVGRCT